MNKVIELRNEALKKLSNKLEGFYLAGGTALSVFYFQHRDSYDLDFFTKEFSRDRIEIIIRDLSLSMELKYELLSEQNKAGFAKIVVYSLGVGQEYALRIDFVEDNYALFEPLENINGVAVLSKQDIYFRKILAACGAISTIDETGKTFFTGGRQEAKDFFDLYFLSKTFMPLSVFAAKYCGRPQIESIIVWYRTYDRMSLKLGLTEIITDKRVDFLEMERHFKSEIELLITEEI